MAARRQQRLVNLVLCLLSTRQFITAERIRQTVEGYELDADVANPTEAFKRSFERDKAELRELGVPLETGRNSAFDTEDGYRIARKDFELPPIDFTPDEVAAVGLAARLWSTASLATEARSALLKLRAAGIDINEPDWADELPPLSAAEPALPELMAAVSARRVISFGYRKAGAVEPEKRTVEPWGVLSWRGRWYVVGHDRARQDVRSFRLDRISGAVRTLQGSATTSRPQGLSMVDIVQGAEPSGSDTAVVRTRPGKAIRLHRMAGSIRTDGGYEVLTIEFRDVGALAGLIAAAGTDAVAVSPPELVDTVIALLRSAAGNPAATDFGVDPAGSRVGTARADREETR